MNASLAQLKNMLLHVNNAQYKKPEKKPGSQFEGGIELTTEVSVTGSKERKSASVCLCVVCVLCVCCVCVCVCVVGCVVGLLLLLEMECCLHIW